MESLLIQDEELAESTTITTTKTPTITTVKI
jgi:hypothetical protein